MADVHPLWTVQELRDLHDVKEGIDEVFVVSHSKMYKRRSGTWYVIEPITVVLKRAKPDKRIWENQKKKGASSSQH